MVVLHNGTATVVQGDYHDELPAGIWVLDVNNGVLISHPLFQTPSVLFGSVKDDVKFIQEKWGKHPQLGVWMQGMKGSGKSITARILTNQLVEEGIPTIVVTEKVTGTVLTKLLAKIPQKVAVLFDEFDKTHPEHEDQESMLTVFDGAFNNKLFIVLTNTEDISQFLKNRPGRIRYKFDYETPQRETIEEVFTHFGVGSDLKIKITNVFSLLGTFSLNTAITLIEECIEGGLEPLYVLKRLNIDLEHKMFNVAAIIGGKHYNTSIHYNPFTTGVIKFSIYNEEDWRHSLNYRLDLKDATVTHQTNDILIRDNNNNDKLYIEPIIKNNNLWLGI